MHCEVKDMHCIKILKKYSVSSSSSWLSKSRQYLWLHSIDLDNRFIKEGSAGKCLLWKSNRNSWPTEGYIKLFHVFWDVWIHLYEQFWSRDHEVPSAGGPEDLKPRQRKFSSIRPWHVFWCRTPGSDVDLCIKATDVTYVKPFKQESVLKSTLYLLLIRVEIGIMPLSLKLHLYSTFMP